MTGDRLSVQQAAATLGVILSVVFVGYEIRQNTRVARATAVQATADQIIQWQAESGTDPEWIRIYDFVRTGGAYADLSSLDQSRYGWVVISTVKIGFVKCRWGSSRRRTWAQVGAPRMLNGFRANTFSTGGGPAIGLSLGHLTSWSSLRRTS